MSAALGAVSQATTRAPLAAASSATSPNVSCSPGMTTQRAPAQLVLGRPGADEPQRPWLGRARGRLEQLEDPFLAREPAGVQHVVGLSDALRAKGVVQPEAQPEARRPPAVGLGIDDRRDRVDGRV